MSRRQKNAFDNFKTNYTELHNELTRFVQDLPSKFKKNVPADLKNVQVVPTIMMPLDPEFTVEYAEQVLAIWKSISDILDSMLQKISYYVVDNGWYKDQQKKMEWWISLVKQSADFLRQETPNTGTVIESDSGIGGINWRKDVAKMVEVKSRQQSIRNLYSALNAIRT